MPACNVLVLGAQRKNLEGFSTANKLHRGYLTETDIFKNTPEDYQKQALRKLASKCVLAARYDAFRVIPVVDKDEDTLQKNSNLFIDEKNNGNNSNNIIDNKENSKGKTKNNIFTSVLSEMIK